MSFCDPHGISVSNVFNMDTCGSKISKQVLLYQTQSPMISTKEATTPEMAKRGNCIFLIIGVASVVWLCIHLLTTQGALDYYCLLTTVYISQQHKGIEQGQSNNIPDGVGKGLKIAETFKNMQQYTTHNIECSMNDAIFTVPQCCLYAICHSSQLSNPSDVTLCTMKPLINANMSMLQCTCHTSTCSSLCLVSG